MSPLIEISPMDRPGSIPACSQSSAWLSDGLLIEIAPSANGVSPAFMVPSKA